MPITKQNLLRHELIGLHVRVSNSSDLSLIGIRGNIADETQNTFLIEQSGEFKRVLKATSTFIFVLPSGDEVEVEGRKLLGRPEERVRR